MNLPNQLTIARILMVPVFVVLMSIDHFVSFAVAYVVFTIATITDYYDGKIARARNLITNFGKLLDPVADKVLLAAAFVMLMVSDPINIPGWTIVAILAREFLITGARSLAASEGQVIAANIWGKRKTVFQMVYVFTFLFFLIGDRIVVRFDVLSEWTDAYQRFLAITSLWGIVVVAVVTLYSGVQFARTNWHTLSLGNTS